MFFARTLPSSTPIWSGESYVSTTIERAVSFLRTEGVDAPDDSLREDLVLVERDERTKRRGREEREHDAVARTVALKHLALHERLASTGAKLLADLLLSLAEGECLRLREVI